MPSDGCSRDSRVPNDTAAGTAAAVPESPAAAADTDAAADLPVVTEEDLANLSNKQLQDMCKIRGVAIYGAKPALIKRLTNLRPGTKRSSRGRKGAGAAAGDAVPMADAGEASDDEEEPTEERYTDPWAEEDEPYDPAADASGGAGVARWLLHVARAIHTAYSHSGTPPPAAIHISKLPGAVPTISISHNTLRVR